MLGASTIIESISKEEKIEYKKLCRILKLTKKDEKARLNIALEALEELEIISRNDKNEYKNKDNNNHLIAKIRCSSKGYCFAVREEKNEDIYIRDNLLNCAWNGDKVLVRIIKEGVKRRSPEGIVDCILERSNKILLGRVEVKNDLVYGIPIDDRILSKIALPVSDIKFLYNPNEKNIVEIAIDMFPIGQMEGKGHVIKELKLENNNDVDNEFVLARNNMANYKNSVVLPTIKPETTERLDLSSMNSFMLKNWKLDNSPLLPIIHVKRKENGEGEIWIHSNSLAEKIDFSNKKIFEFFKNNLESYPLLSKWKNFLPESILSESEFKLDKKNDAISLCINLSKDLEIIDYSFHLTSVKCKFAINEKHLEALINRNNSKRIVSRLLKPIKDYIDDLDYFIEISKGFRQKQLNKGRIEISIENSEIEYINEYFIHSPGEYIKEYLAPLNIKDCQTYLSPIIYEADSIWFDHSKGCNLLSAAYYQQSINYININELIKQSNLISSEIELDEEGTSSLKQIFDICDSEDKKRILNKYLIGTIRDNKAKLSVSGNTSKDEFIGLAPWTIPSYDYLNLINQYSIFNLYKNGKKSTKNSKKIDILRKNSWKSINWNLLNNNNLKVVKNLFDINTLEKFNENKNKLQNYKNNMINIKQIREAEKLVGQAFDGLITTVQSYGFFVELINLKVEGLVHVSTLNNDWYEYRSRQNMLVGRKSKNTFRVGDRIDIKIIRVDILKYQIDLEIIHKN